MVLPFLHERKIYLNETKEDTKSVKKSFFTSIEETIEQNGQKMLVNKIISMDVTGHKFMIYSEGGLLSKRICYKKEVEKYGNPISVSDNGRIFIFQSQKENSRWNIHILKMTSEGFVFIKSIHIRDAIYAYVDQLGHTP